MPGAPVIGAPMSGAQQFLATGAEPWPADDMAPALVERPRGSDVSWAVAFLVPYVAVFLAFVVYPVGFGLGWAASRNSTATFQQSALSDDRVQHIDAGRHRR